MEDMSSNKTSSTYALGKFGCHVKKWEQGCGADECQRARRIVIARGTLPCDILFIGEAPGKTENLVGLPFVGPAGKLLDHIIERSIDPRFTYALTNLVGCIPLDDDGDKTEQPTDEQIVKCAERLGEFIGICRPKLVVCVGTVARDWLDVKRRDHVDVGQAMFAKTDIVHPAFILRSNVAQRSFLVQRCVVTISNAVAEYCEGDQKGD